MGIEALLAKEGVKNDVLYHYCDANAFISILSHKILWLSSLRVSNDWNEGKLFINELKKRIAQESESAANYSHEFVKYINQLILDVENTHGLGMCLSREGDLLSQWRGYARDGQGFAIGFSRKRLKKFVENYDVLTDEGRLIRENLQIDSIGDDDKALIKIEPIDYKAARNIERIVKQKFSKSKKCFNSGSLKEDSLAKDLFRYSFIVKSKGFVEEQEERILLNCNNLMMDRLINTKYRESCGRLVPYTELNFAQEEILIEKIIIGPKNPNSIQDVQLFLKLRGYSHDLVHRGVTKSAISYR